jgi:hypothetical protein
MKIEIYLDSPSHYENVEEIERLIGSTKVKAYSLDLENNDIVEGLGWVASNDSYNYHNNYDDSQNVLWFEGEQRWFTLNYDRALQIQKDNSVKILEKLQPIINIETAKL